MLMGSFVWFTNGSIARRTFAADMRTVSLTRGGEPPARRQAHQTRDGEFLSRTSTTSTSPISSSSLPRTTPVVGCRNGAPSRVDVQLDALHHLILLSEAQVKIRPPDGDHRAAQVRESLVQLFADEAQGLAVIILLGVNRTDGCAEKNHERRQDERRFLEEVREHEKPHIGNAFFRDSGGAIPDP